MSRAFGLRATVLAVLLIAASPQLAFGWSQLRNHYPYDPKTCDNSAQYPCIKWPQSGTGYSITIYVYEDYTLTQANINLQTDMGTACQQWTAIAARNPFSYCSGNGVNYQVGAYRAATVHSDSWAETVTYSSGHTVTSATIKFNPLVTWNRNLTYSTYQADARKVAVHEMGHAEALGHTKWWSQVMHQGGLNFWQPQAGDIQGMQAIYGAP